MKSIKFLFAAVFVFTIISCSAQTQQDSNDGQVLQSDKVEVYYFHYSRRCATCEAVESVSKEAVSELYGNKVIFTDFNLDEEAGEAKGKELEVSGQTLLIVSGKTKIDLTNQGFLNARTNPDKLKAIIKENIDPLL